MAEHDARDDPDRASQPDEPPGARRHPSESVGVSAGSERLGVSVKRPGRVQRIEDHQPEDRRTPSDHQSAIETPPHQVTWKTPPAAGSNVMSPPFGDTGRPVAESMFAMSGDVADVPDHLK